MTANQMISNFMINDDGAPTMVLTMFIFSTKAFFYVTSKERPERSEE